MSWPARGYSAVTDVLKVRRSHAPAAWAGVSRRESSPDRRTGKQQVNTLPRFARNAYNAFTLAAIVDEYPITSVWKT